MSNFLRYVMYRSAYEKASDQGGTFWLGFVLGTIAILWGACEVLG